MINCRERRNGLGASFLPPAYVVRREGNSFTLLVCPHLGGYPYPIMLCNITQNAKGQTPGGGVPGQVQLGGYPYPIMLCNITQNSMGQTPGGGVPSQDQLGGYPVRSGWGYPARGTPQQGTPLGQDWGYPGVYPGRVPPRGPGQDGGVPCRGYPVRTTGVLTTRRVVCLLRSRRGLSCSLLF